MERENKEKQYDNNYNLELLRSTIQQRQDIIEAQQRQLNELHNKL